MPDPEMVLAMTAATTIVAAMATSAWQTARTGVMRLFRRGGQGQPAAVATQLDDDARLVAAAEDPGRIRQGLAPAWELRLEALLRQYPEAEGELRTLVEQTGALLPQAEQAWVQTNLARDGGQVFAAQGGNVIVHQTPLARAETPQPEGGQ